MVKDRPTAVASAQALTGIRALCHHSLVFCVANMKLVMILRRKAMGNAIKEKRRQFSSLVIL